jgi:hypothetical protein
MMTTERDKNRRHRVDSIVAFGVSMFGVDWHTTFVFLLWPLPSSYPEELSKLERNIILLHEKFWSVGGLP